MEVNIWNSGITDGNNIWDDDSRRVEIDASHNIFGTTKNSNTYDNASSNDEAEDTDDANNPILNLNDDQMKKDYIESSKVVNTTDDMPVGKQIQNETSISESFSTPITTSDTTNEDYSDDFGDDFGAFEKIPIPKLEFDVSLEVLVEDIMPVRHDTTNKSSTYADEFIKSIYLTDGGMMPMKCYNSITSNSRQFMAGQVDPFSIATRGGCLQSNWYNEMCKISDKWIFDDVGIAGSRDENGLSSWKDTNKISLFKWTSKSREEKKAIVSDNSIVERKRIGERLMNAAMVQANTIIGLRRESERVEEDIVTHQRQERERKLEQERLKREESNALYSKAIPIEKKKITTLGKLFKGKSKISKDHLSHKKLELSNSLEVDDKLKDLSLKEQMELEINMEGAGPKNTTKTKYRRKNRRGSGSSSEDDDDDNGGDGFEDEGGSDLGYRLTDSTDGYGCIGETTGLEIEDTKFYDLQQHMDDENGVDEESTEETVTPVKRIENNTLNMNSISSRFCVSTKKDDNEQDILHDRLPSLNLSQLDHTNHEDASPKLRSQQGYTKDSQVINLIDL